MPSQIDMDSNPTGPASARAGTREEALRLLKTQGVATLELDYESGWQDAVELGRLGQKVGISVEFRGHESVAVSSVTALVAGLTRPKVTFRQRNLYCRFDLNRLPAGELERLEAKAASLGDYVLGGHLLPAADVVWSEQPLSWAIHPTMSACRRIQCVAPASATQVSTKIRSESAHF